MKFARPLPAALLTTLLVAIALVLAGCASTSPNPRAGDELKFASVDLPRYMGKWYIIANIPFFGERDYVGSYAEWTLRPDGKIADVFVGKKGGFDAPETLREFVDTIVPDSGNAKWSVRLFWPIYVTQLTLYVDPDYRTTILGYPGKSLGWIFARSPEISNAAYRDLLGRLDAQGYDTSLFKRVPQTPDQVGKPGFQSPGQKN